MSAKHEPLLQVQNLGIAFGGQAVVQAVSFELQAGRTLALVGESGSGKSLTALSVAGLLPPEARMLPNSSIRLRDREQLLDLHQLPEADLQNIRGRHIGFVFQEPMSSLNPVMRCGMQVAEVLQRHLGLSAKAAKARTLELFAEVQLPAHADAWHAYPHQFSGGQKQRVMIAMAIACKPALLIADEPTTALDATVQQEIIQLLKRLQQAHGMAILFITHDLGLVRDLAEEVAVMRQGQVVEAGDITSILERPQHAYTKGLLACRPSVAFRGQLLPTLRDFAAPESRSIPHEVIHAKALKNNTPILEIERINSYFEQAAWLPWQRARKPGITGIGFTVYKGETLGIVGESGSGKTTLGRIVSGLIERYDGAIQYKGAPIRRGNRYDRRRLSRSIQMIFQDSAAALNPYKTISSILLEPLAVHGLYGNAAGRKTAIQRMLARVQLPPDTLQRYPHQFSGGQRQRICIVRALLLQPELLILDEAVSALDVSLQAEIINLLSEIKAELNLTYLFITHDLALVQYFCDRVLVLQNGRLVDQGAADTLFASSTQAYTRQLVKAAKL